MLLEWWKNEEESIKSKLDSTVALYKAEGLMREARQKRLEEGSELLQKKLEKILWTEFGKKCFHNPVAPKVIVNIEEVKTNEETMDLGKCPK